MAENINRNAIPDENPMPRFEVFPVDRVMSRVLKELGKMSMLPSQVDLSVSEHNRGAAPMLDEQLELQFPDKKADAGFEDGGRWSDQGEYLGRD